MTACDGLINIITYICVIIQALCLVLHFHAVQYHPNDLRKRSRGQLSPPLDSIDDFIIMLMPKTAIWIPFRLAAYTTNQIQNSYQRFREQVACYVFAKPVSSRDVSCEAGCATFISRFSRTPGGKLRRTPAFAGTAGNHKAHVDSSVSMLRYYKRVLSHAD